MQNLIKAGTYVAIAVAGGITWSFGLKGVKKFRKARKTRKTKKEEKDSE